MPNISVRERISALEQQHRPSTSEGVADAHRRISSNSTSMNVKQRASYFQGEESRSRSRSSGSDSAGGTSNDTTSSNTGNASTPPSTNPPSSPRIDSSSVQVESGSVGSADNSIHTPTPASPAFTATTDVHYQVPELVETDLEHNQEIIQLLRNDKQLSFAHETQTHAHPQSRTDVLQATHDLANLSTSFDGEVGELDGVLDVDSSISSASNRDSELEADTEAGWVTVITT
ncbi:hypothetical protein E3P86_01176 [Wallemia ichthyophaga]|uniref:Uncharacterized protein n=1 Tax=Wallemia ichthyophaga TaxID=245174 RepID=A0A4T0JA33_WALIC|nr:hypothetical protein E3P86_01176 [Wallemia ichthyophaga]